MLTFDLFLRQALAHPFHLGLLRTGFQVGHGGHSGEEGRLHCDKTADLPQATRDADYLCASAAAV